MTQLMQGGGMLWQIDPTGTMLHITSARATPQRRATRAVRSRVSMPLRSRRRRCPSACQCRRRPLRPQLRAAPCPVQHGLMVQETARL